MYAHYGNSDFDRRVCKSEKHLPQYELLGKRGHMKQIRQLSTDKDYDELIEKCRESIYRFEHIAETETPSFGNVF